MANKYTCTNCQTVYNSNNRDACPVCKTPEQTPLMHSIEVVDPSEQVVRTTGLRKASVSIPTKVFPLLTMNEVPGKVIVEALGLVIGAGTRQMGLTSSNLVTNTFKTASEQLVAATQVLKADAVVSIKMSLEERQGNLGTINQTVTLTGTAVRIK